jgi:hypothetical protein
VMLEGLLCTMHHSTDAHLLLSCAPRSGLLPPLSPIMESLPQAPVDPLQRKGLGCAAPNKDELPPTFGRGA